MQDSLQDYLQIARNANKLSPSQKAVGNIVADATRKKQCETHAQKVVEFLIEGKLQPVVFLRSLSFINVSLYEDVVDERSITSLCGYPLCGLRLPEMPKKKYFISSKVNKVYDITERKKYCSNFCYKASTHIKEQIDDSPLWLRNLETHPSYKLLENTHSGLTPGEEIVYGVEDPSNSQVAFTSISDFAEACLGESEEFEKMPQLEGIEAFRKLDSMSKCSPPIKSILKQQVINGDSPQDDKLPQVKEKKVIFQEETATELSEQQQDLNRCIRNLCKSLNIKLDLNNSSENTNQLQEKPPVYVDEEKMQRVIEKVAKSEEQRNKPIQLIDATMNPEITSHCSTILFPHSETVLRPPKYAERLLGIVQRSNADSKQNLNAVDIRNKSDSTIKSHYSGKSITSKPSDAKMQQIIDKINLKKRQPKQEKKCAILIETVTNPELQTEKNRMQESELRKQTKNIQFTRLTNDEFNDILQAFRSWLTIETFLYLYGESKLKEIINPEKLEKYFQQLHVEQANVSQQLNYLEICKKLHMKEVADEKFDEKCIEGQKGGLNPLPDYNQLKSDMKNLDSKVKAFYTRGIYERNADNAEYRNESTDNGEFVTPISDSSKNVLRRNIFSKSLMKCVLNEMVLDESIPKRLQELINTFKFEASNITFLPGQWNIIALTLLSCLSRKDKTEHQSNQQPFEDYVNSFVMESTRFAAFLSEIYQLIDNVDGFIQTYIECNNL